MDATLGGAGHSFEVAQRIGCGGTLIGIDQDDVALAAAARKLGSLPDELRPHLELVRNNFGNMDEALLSVDVPGVDAFLFDIGVSSVQIDTPSRGFSFKEDGPLDMRTESGEKHPNRSRGREHLQRSRPHSDASAPTPMSGGPAASRTSSSAPARRPRLKRARSWSTSSRRLSRQARAALADILPSARSRPCASKSMASSTF